MICQAGYLDKKATVGCKGFKLSAFGKLSCSGYNSPIFALLWTFLSRTACKYFSLFSLLCYSLSLFYSTSPLFSLLESGKVTFYFHSFTWWWSFREVSQDFYSNVLIEFCWHIKDSCHKLKNAKKKNLSNLLLIFQNVKVHGYMLRCMDTLSCFFLPFFQRLITFVTLFASMDKEALMKRFFPQGM